MATTYDIDINVDAKDAIKGLTKLEQETVNAATSVSKLKTKLKELEGKSKGMDKRTKEFKKLKGEIEKTNKELVESKKSLKGLATGLKAGSKGFKGLGLAMKATGIGVVLILVNKLVDVLKTQQPILDATEVAFRTISVAVKAVSDVIREMFKSQSDANGGFEASGKVIGGLITIALTPFRLALLAIEGAVLGAQLAWEMSWFGGGDEARIEELKQGLKEVGDEVVALGESVVEAGTDIVTNIVDAAVEVGGLVGAVVEGISEIDAATILANSKAAIALKKRAQIAEAVNAGILQQYDRLAEKDRQIRDDLTESIEVRIIANDKLGLTLEKQERLMIKNAQIVVSAAQADLKANDNIENRVALIRAKNEVMDVEAAIEGFRSEQLINQFGLEVELAEKNQLATERISARGIVSREFTTGLIEDDIKRLNSQKENLAIEKEIELARLQIVIDNTGIGTLARVTAEQDLADNKLRLKQEAEALDVELAEVKKTRESDAAAHTKELSDQAAIDFKEAEEKKLKVKEDVTSSINDLTATVFALTNSFGKQDDESREKRAKRQFQINKATQLAGAVVDTTKAITTQLAAAPVVIGVAPNPAAIAALVATAASGAASIAKIASTRYKSASVAAVAPPSIGGGGNLGNIDTSGPTSTFVGTGGETGGSVNNTAGSNQAPIIIQNNIVESDITDAQSNVANIVEYAGFGLPG